MIVPESSPQAISRILETHAKAVEQAGAPVVVYLQVKDAVLRRDLRRRGQSDGALECRIAAGAHDGLVIFLNLQPGNEHHGQVALFAGEKHFQDGNLPESELQRIYEDVMCRGWRMEISSAASRLGLDAAAHSLRYGPPVDPTQQAAANFGRSALQSCWLGCWRRPVWCLSFSSARRPAGRGRQRHDVRQIDLAPR